MNIRPNPFHQQIWLRKVKRGDSEYTVRENRDRYFFPDEWKAFYDNLKKDNHKISKQRVTFNVLLNTGVRIMEGQNIKVSDIDLERGNIVLRVTKKIINRPGIDKEGKSKVRVITISTQHAKFLKRVIKDYNLKPNDKLPILTTAGANIALKKCLKDVGVPDYEMFSVHNLRKTNENWLLAMGIDLYKILKQLGHTYDVSMEHYLSTDVFGFDEKDMINNIMGDLPQKMMGTQLRRLR